MKYLFIILVAIPLLAPAENLGTYGQTFPLNKDAREQLKDTIRRKQQSGELDKFWHEYRDKTVSQITNPQPLGVKSDYAASSNVYELKFTFPKDVVNEKGQVVVKKGTVIEPLRLGPLKTGLMFIDGRDQKQIDFAIQQSISQPLKIVLTAGSPTDLRKKYRNFRTQNRVGVPFYFDQRKMIINSLHRYYGISLASVPAKVYQEGYKLRIDYGMKP